MGGAPRTGSAPTLFIDGRWEHSADGAVREIRSPADQHLIAVVDEAGAVDTGRAIAAARRAFDTGPWPSTPATERAALLHRLGDLLQRDLDTFAAAESGDTGKRMVDARADIADVIACIRYFAGLAGTLGGRVVDTANADAIAQVVTEPVGVCGLITPWNYPLLQATWKLAPALAAGNTVVLKPSEQTPSTAILMMAALAEAGLPAGVANLVLGAGPSAGAPLATDPAVDLLSFTGGLVTGRILMAAAAATVKKVALELGGKNPNIVFADADLDAALAHALTAVFLHSGQVCSAGARLVIEASIHDAFVDELVARAQRIRLGGPDDPHAHTGPLISSAHRDKVAAYVAAGIAEGAVLRCGGGPPIDPTLQQGWYYLPTVLDSCNGRMRCVQEESFGPVLTVETFTTEAQAIAIGNDTHFGLAGAVWTQDAGKAARVARALRHGTVWINDYHPYLPQAEWGGFKQSGIGRELGPSGLAEYCEVKHVYHNIRPGPSRWLD